MPTRRSSGPPWSSRGIPLRWSAWRRRGSSARRCAPTRPTCGSRCSRSRSSTAAARCCDQPVGAWLRVIGRLRPGASIDGMAPRLTGVLRPWMQYDSGYPANWMPDVIRMLPKQSIAVVPAGAGVGVMKEQYGSSLQILLAVCGLVLLDRVRERGEPAAGPGRRPSGTDGAAPRHRRDEAADRDAGARRERPARGGRRTGRPGGRGRCRPPAARPGLHRRTLSADQRSAVARRAGCSPSAWRS